MDETRREEQNSKGYFTPEVLRNDAKKCGWSSAGWAGATAVGTFITLKVAPIKEVPDLFVAGGIGVGVLNIIYYALESIDLFKRADQARSSQTSLASQR
jgi:hypothetical protein